NRGQWDEAEKSLRGAVALNPKYGLAWNNLGLTLGQKGQYSESLAAFKHAVPEPEAFANLGFVLMTQGKKEEAKQAYREALARVPDLRVAQAALVRLESPTPPSPAAPVARAQSDAPAAAQR